MVNIIYVNIKYRKEQVYIIIHYTIFIVVLLFLYLYLYKPQGDFSIVKIIIIIQVQVLKMFIFLKNNVLIDLIEKYENITKLQLT